MRRGSDGRRRTRSMRRSRWRPRSMGAPPQSPISICRHWSLPMSNNNGASRQARRQRRSDAAARSRCCASAASCLPARPASSARCCSTCCCGIIPRSSASTADSRRPPLEPQPLSARDSRFAGDGAAARALGARFDRYVEDKVAVVAGDITEPGFDHRRRRDARCTASSTR